MRKKELWMRHGARVLAGGRPGEVISIWSQTIDGDNYVHYIDVCLDGSDEVVAYRADEVQRDRIVREVAHA